MLHFLFFCFQLVKNISKSQAEYDIVLDMLFSAAGLIESESVQDDTNIGRVLLIMLIRSQISLSDKIELIRKLDALPNTKAGCRSCSSARRRGRRSG